MSPFFTLEEAIHKAAFEKHTYGHTTMGFAEDIQRMPEMYDYSRSFFQRYYRPENVVLLVVGDVQPPAVMALARRYYAGWKPGYVAPQAPVDPPQTAERRIDVPYTAGKTLPVIMVGYKNDRFDPQSRSFISSMVLADLAFGETSALHKKLVLDEQVTEFIEAESSMNRDPSLFAIIARVKDPAKVDYVLGEIDRTVGEFQTTPPDAKRVADVKSRTKYGFLMNLETPSAVAGALARIVALTGGAEAVDQMFTTLDGVTPKDVQTAARTTLGRERRTVAVLQEGER
jgi:zinc protease